MYCTIQILMKLSFLEMIFGFPMPIIYQLDDVNCNLMANTYKSILMALSNESF